MKQYLDLLQHILENGNIKKNRTGIDTISTFGQHFKYHLQNGFPLLTTKKIKWENILFENLWFLSGNSKWDFLHKHNITFWDAWDEGNGQLPEAYGKYWRNYPEIITDSEYPDWFDLGYGFDQFRTIIEALKKDPNNRRLVLTNWYAPFAHKAKLPPCHLLSIFNTQYDEVGNPELCLHMTQRSCDVPVGVPYNIAGYSFILSLVAHLTGLPVGELSITFVDAHIYVNQIEAVKEQVKRKPSTLPQLIISPDIKSLSNIDELIKDGTTEEILDKFKIINYNPQNFIKMPVAV